MKHENKAAEIKFMRVYVNPPQGMNTFSSMVLEIRQYDLLISLWKHISLKGLQKEPALIILIVYMLPRYETLRITLFCNLK